MDKYIAEREAKRLGGIAIPKHIRYTTSHTELAFAGLRQVDGQMLVLLRRGDEVMVMPVDDAAARWLKRLPIGDAVAMTGQGTLKRAQGRSR